MSCESNDGHEEVYEQEWQKSDSNNEDGEGGDPHQTDLIWLLLFFSQWWVQRFKVSGLGCVGGPMFAFAKGPQNSSALLLEELNCYYLLFF